MHRRIRVYEVADEMGLDRVKLASLLRSMGSPGVQNYMSLVDVDWLERAREQLALAGADQAAEPRAETALRRRRLVSPSSPGSPATTSPLPPAAPSVSEAFRGPEAAALPAPAQPAP